MTFTPLPPFSGIQPPEITPFTYPDGVTNLEILRALRSRLVTLIAEVNTGMLQLTEDVGAEINALIDQVNSAIQENNTVVDEKISELTDDFNTIVAQIINNSIEVQDPVVAGAVRDDESETRAELDQLYYRNTPVYPGDNVTVKDSEALASGLHLVFMPGVHVFTENTTIVSPVLAQPGALLQPEHEVQVTLSGGIYSDATHTFDQTLGGIVVPEKVDWHVGWWGVTGTDDDTATWAAMSDSNASRPVGEYITIKTPSVVNRFSGIELHSCTLDGSGYGTAYAPPVDFAGEHEYLLQINYGVDVYGGTWRSDGHGDLKIIQQTAHRCVIRNARFNVSGNTETYGVYVINTSSVTPKIIDCLFYGGDGTGTAIWLGSADSELTNVWIGLTHRGVVDIKGSTTMVACHIWECYDYGVSLSSGSRMIGCYIETMRGWGVILRASSGNVISGTRFWKNGTHQADTGGILISGKGSSGGNVRTENNILADNIYDDNVGVGVKLIRAFRTKISGKYVSSNTYSSNPPLSTHAVSIDAESIGTEVDVSGSSGATLLEPVVNESTSTHTSLGKINIHTPLIETIPDDNVFRSVAIATLGGNETWFFKGYFVVEVDAATDIRMRVQCVSLDNGKWQLENASTGANEYLDITVTGGGARSVDGHDTLPVRVSFDGFVTTGSQRNDLRLQLARVYETSTPVNILATSVELIRVG